MFTRYGRDKLFWNWINIALRVLYTFYTDYFKAEAVVELVSEIFVPLSGIQTGLDIITSVQLSRSDWRLVCYGSGS